MNERKDYESVDVLSEWMEKDEGNWVETLEIDGHSWACLRDSSGYSNNSSGVLHHPDCSCWKGGK